MLGAGSGVDAAGRGPDEGQGEDLAGRDWRAYAEVVATSQGYRLDEAQLGRVAEQLQLIAKVAAPLLALDLPAEVEPAPVFRP